nr:S49 family peptidase [Phycisphaerales bacterium]
MSRSWRSVRMFVGVVAVAAGMCSAAWAGEAAPGRQDRSLVRMLELNGAIPERPSPLAWLMSEKDNPTLRAVLASLRRARDDASVAGIVIRLKDAQLQTAQVEEIGSAITALRSAGKKVYVFSESYGPAELMLGSYADDVIAQSGGGVMLTGMHMEEMFLADTLAWVGIKADMVQVGDYKGAGEQMGRRSPSPQWEQNISGLLDGLYANMRQRLMTGRNLSSDALDRAMSDLWLADADEAKKAGLVDTVIDLPGLESHLSVSLGSPIRWGSALAEKGRKDSLAMSNPLAMLSKLAETPDHAPTGPTIAVVHIDGAIVDGDSTSGGILGGGGNVGSRTIRNALEEIRDQDLIKGVVVRINSPGGSATASEVIWTGIRRVSERKPVWVSVGSMAASGGYYCAVAGDRIFVDPSSIVGSIGVVGGRMSLDGVYEKLKVNVVSRSRGPRSDLFRTTGPWTDQEIVLVREKMARTYDLFTRRVSAGRPGIDLSKTAEGRLFTGNQAIGLKMADEVGGLSSAIESLASSVGLSNYDVQDYPGPKGIGETIGEMLGGFVSAPGSAVSWHTGVGLAGDFAAAGRALLGERGERERGAVGGAKLRM